MSEQDISTTIGMPSMVKRFDVTHVMQFAVEGKGVEVKSLGIGL